MGLREDLNRYTPRKEQDEALEFVKKVHTNKPDNKFYLMNLPVGTGKSHLALMISQWFLNTVSQDSKIDIITPGKILQDQYDEEYESVTNLKGKENYNCSSYSCSCAQGKEFNKLNKTVCDFCPYDNAKEAYIGGRVSLTNFHLYLIHSLYTPKLLESRASRLLIVDECHLLDEVMSDFISIKITETIVKKLRFDNEDEIISKLKYVATIDDYIHFLDYFRGQIILTIAKTNNNMITNPTIAKNTKRDLKLSKILDYVNDDVKSIQVMADLKQYETKIDVFLKEYNDDRDNWVLEKSYNEKTKQYELSLEPIWSYKYLNKYVWDNYDMVVLMSGTILSKRIFSELNGLDLKKCVYYSIPSPFPIENRQIFYMPLGKMSYAKKEETFVNYKNFLDKILNKYKDSKGIIHTNSFELSTWIKNGVKNKRLLFHDSVNKTEMLKKHFDSDDPTVLISPSVSTGVSFDGDKSRFQIIAKVPYPSLASQKNKLRQKNNPEWYAWKTCAILQQMCGRSIRSKTDFADTIIIDGSFGDIIKYSSEYLPIWFQESIKRVNVKL